MRGRRVKGTGARHAGNVDDILELGERWCGEWCGQKKFAYPEVRSKAIYDSRNFEEWSAHR